MVINLIKQVIFDISREFGAKVSWMPLNSPPRLEMSWLSCDFNTDREPVSDVQ